MSYWGSTVITNLLHFLPDSLNVICGNCYVSNCTFYRFYIIHMILVLLVMILYKIHLYYLHVISSNCSIGYITNNLNYLLYEVFSMKDYLSLIILSIITVDLIYLGYYNVCHSDNHVEINNNVTPLHIVPEWYFLSFYMILKIYPNKSLGLLMFVISILMILILMETKNLTSISRMLIFISGYEMEFYMLYYCNLIFYELWLGLHLSHDHYMF